MIKLYDGQISDLIANGAKYNPEIKAISYAVLKEKQRIIDQAQKTRALALIDELSEQILDILAVELRTPFYQEDFTIMTKRELIKDTLFFYTYMGTPEAVNRMLSAVSPGSCIKEWFEYGGKPYCFRAEINTDISVNVDIRKIVRTINTYKRLSAHMDALCFAYAYFVPVEYANKSRAAIELNVRQKTEILYLDDTWQLDSLKRLNAYDPEKYIDYYPIYMGAEIPGVYISTMSRTALRACSKLTEKVFYFQGTSVFAACLDISKRYTEKTAAASAVNVSVGTQNGNVRIVNNLDGTWILNETRKLNAGIYQI